MNYTEKDVYPRIASMGEVGMVTLFVDLFNRIENLEKMVEDMRPEEA
jgi:hypothetical protein